jgi:hypothetical protein
MPTWLDDQASPCPTHHDASTTSLQMQLQTLTGGHSFCPRACPQPTPRPCRGRRHLRRLCHTRPSSRGHSPRPTPGRLHHGCIRIRHPLPFPERPPTCRGDNRRGCRTTRPEADRIRESGAKWLRLRTLLRGDVWAVAPAGDEALAFDIR